jgi:hypothetical protein
LRFRRSSGAMNSNETFFLEQSQMSQLPTFHKKFHFHQGRKRKASKDGNHRKMKGLKKTKKNAAEFDFTFSWKTVLLMRMVRFEILKRVLSPEQVRIYKSDTEVVQKVIIYFYVV